MYTGRTYNEALVAGVIRVQQGVLIVQLAPLFRTVNCQSCVGLQPFANGFARCKIQLLLQAKPFG